MNEQRYDILGNELIVYPDGAGVRGEVTVNGTVYRVHMNSPWGAVHINGMTIHTIHNDLGKNVTKTIAGLQKYNAWQQAQYGVEDFEITMDTTKWYNVSNIVFWVYRADDATCWQYYTGSDDYECQHYSPWYPSEIQPSADHFKAWIISTIEVSNND